MKKIIMSVLILLNCFLITTFVLGCNPLREGKILITDMAGDEVYIDENPKKVAAVSPSTGDLMIAFGMGEYLDGTYYSVLDNSWAKEIYPTSIELFGYDYDTSVETFIVRDVDLIFIPEPTTARNLRKHGLNALCIRQFAETGYDEYVFTFSNIVKQIWPVETSEIVDYWQNDFLTAVREVKKVLDDHEVDIRTLYYICGDKDRGLGYTDLGKSMLEYVFDILKIDFICDRFETNRPSVEAVAKEDPDLVVIGGIYQRSLFERIHKENVWKDLRAVNENNVYTIPLSFVSWEQTSAESSLFIYDIANKLYPNLFDFDIGELTKQTLNKYFNYKINDQNLNYMLQGLDKNGQWLI
ncbi:TroA family protein [Spiroplasma culicicola]|uniref:Iron compounds ABC transporter periplasmic binding component n=1 Tax=Spiroplasma culicicola AES-1 TaxID=1276246 RepID=W6A705_9MOLU|nr:ABC transporter substrate-binding protein [Spiroplasma culicicola]AHI52767.1 iron compounds ABC transporter periplasmic binding component [Spiroplasma culicicola AES-1]